MAKICGDDDDDDDDGGGDDKCIKANNNGVLPVVEQPLIRLTLLLRPFFLCVYVRSVYIRSPDLSYLNEDKIAMRNVMDRSY